MSEGSLPLGTPLATTAEKRFKTMQPSTSSPPHTSQPQRTSYGTPSFTLVKGALQTIVVTRLYRPSAVENIHLVGILSATNLSPALFMQASSTINGWLIKQGGSKVCLQTFLQCRCFSVPPPALSLTPQLIVFFAQGGFKTWKKRWFVLSRDELTYYAQPYLINCFPVSI